MNLFKEFIKQYGVTLLYTILTSIASYIGLKIKNIYERDITNKNKKEIVETCVKATEQVYKDLHGQAKYNKAIESITAMLNERGITMTDLEIKMLIEATCQSFVKEVESGN